MSPEQFAVEVSRWTREAERAVARRMSAGQLGEAFDEPTTIPRFIGAEAVRIMALGLLVAVIAGWAAILGG